MATRVAHHGHHEIRRAIDDLWLVGEIGVRVDEPHQFDRPHHAGQVTATGRFQLRQQADRAQAGGSSPSLDLHPVAKAALDQPIRPVGDLARDMDHVPDLHIGDIIGRRRRGHRQGHAQFGQFRVDRHGILPGYRRNANRGV